IGIAVKQHHIRQEEIDDLVADIVLEVFQRTHDFDLRLSASKSKSPERVNRSSPQPLRSRDSASR
ncbi:MAG: hypothetical protein LBC20_07665, partial [Planctomycetaceae bacterium]|nr:hypothetical protein [Planctomycetaceae bacterium]